MRAIVGLAAIGMLAIGGAAWAQQQPPATGPATTVQLPSFSYFSVNTTVSVPDRGGAYLGGVNYARDASATRGFGPLANRAVGGDRLASGVSVHATIHDMKEMDDAVLADAAAKRGGIDPEAAKAELLSRHVGRTIAATGGSGATGGLSTRAPGTAGQASSGTPGDSVAAIRARNSAAAQQRTNEAADYFAQAQQAEKDGKPIVAKIFYQMVTRHDEGQLKQRALARLAALDGKATTVAKR